MSNRNLHKKDFTRSSKSIREIIESRAKGSILLITPDDERLETFQPTGQRTLTAESWSFMPEAESYVGYIPHKGTADPLPYDKGQFDTVISLYSKRQLVERMVPFHEFLWITRQGGTILQATGLRPTADRDHDFSGWVSDSKDATLNEIVATRHEDFATPNILSEWTVTSKSHKPVTRR